MRVRRNVTEYLAPGYAIGGDLELQRISRVMEMKCVYRELSKS